MTSLLLGLCLKQALTDFECLATPLPQVLAQLRPILGKPVTYDPVLATEPVIVSVTQVEPRELLERIAQAVGGVIEEDSSGFTLLSDKEFEAKIVKVRDEVFARRYERWQQDLAKPVRAFNNVDVDLSSLTRFVTPTLLKSLPLDASYRYSRPMRAGEKLLPPHVVPQRVLPQTYNGRKVVGAQVDVRSNTQGLRIVAHAVLDDGNEVPFYSWGVTTYSDPPVLREEFQVSEAIRRRYDAATSLLRWQSTDQVLPTHEIEVFKGRPWGEEPLNAITAPYLTEVARLRGLDIVACLPDQAAITGNQSGRFQLYALTLGQLVRSEGEWLVVTPSDPRATRAERTNRVRAKTVIDEATAQGTMDFWSFVQYRNEPRALSLNALRLESAAIGPLALAVLSSFVSSERPAQAFLELKKNGTAWAALTSGESVPVRSLAPAARQGLDSALNEISRISFTVSQTVARGNQVSTTATTRSVPRAEVGLGSGLPDNAMIRLTEVVEPFVLCESRQRKYVVVTSLVAYAHSIAYSEAGKGDENMHAKYVAEGLYPLNRKQYSLSIDLGGGRYVSSFLSLFYFEVPFGTQTYTRDTLPGEFKTRYESFLRDARRAVGG